MARSATLDDFSERLGSAPALVAAHIEMRDRAHDASAKRRNQHPASLAGGALGQARELKVALSGLFRRFVARTYLERYLDLSISAHLTSRCALFCFATIRATSRPSQLANRSRPRDLRRAVGACAISNANWALFSSW